MTRPDSGIVCGDLDPYGTTDMLALARASLQEWSDAGARTAAEGRAARRLAFAFRRLDALGAFRLIDTLPGVTELLSPGTPDAGD